LVGLLESSCRYKRFLSSLGCSSQPSTKYYFHRRTLFHFISPYCLGTWAGRRAGSPISVSLVRIRIWNAIPDPGASKLTKINIYNWFLAFQKDFCTSDIGMFKGSINYIKYFFHVKIQRFVTAKSDQDPDPHESALVCLPGSGSLPRQKAGSGSALKPIRILRSTISECGSAPKS
jgi:hypothetical protein